MTNSFIYDFYCIIAPPDPIPNKLRIVGICDTTAELAWEKPEEVGRDDFYYSINRTNPDTSEEIVVNVNYTVEPLITDPPRSGQPLYSGQVPCYRLNLA